MGMTMKTFRAQGRKFSTIGFCLLMTFGLVACSQEQQNKVSRIGVSWLDGNYKVTYADGEHVKTWVVKDGKVTSEPAKGYYYFWASVNDEKIYVQTPIARTYIEELP
jgi:hypothetical protein